MLLGSLPICSWSFDKIRVIYYRELTTKPFENKDLCLALLLMLSFGRSKIVLVWPNWFGLDQMIWSWPKWNGHDQNELVRSKLWFSTKMNHNLDLTNSFWSWPFHYGCDQIIMVKSKSIWSDQNHFGPTKTVLVTQKDEA